MAWYDNRHRVSPYRRAHSPSVTRTQSGHGGKFAIRRQCAVWHLAQGFPYLYLKLGTQQIQGQVKASTPARKIFGELRLGEREQTLDFDGRIFL